MLRLPEPDNFQERDSAGRDGDRLHAVHETTRDGGGPPDSEGREVSDPATGQEGLRHLGGVARLRRRPANPLFRAGPTDAQLTNAAEPAADASTGDEPAGERPAGVRQEPAATGRPGTEGDGDPGAGRQWARDVSGSVRGHGEGGGPVRGHAEGGEQVCDFGCPLCAAVATMRELQPETMGHFTAATREFMAAVRSFTSSLDGPLPRKARQVRRVQRFKPGE